MKRREMLGVLLAGAQFVSCQELFAKGPLDVFKSSSSEKKESKKKDDFDESDEMDSLSTTVATQMIGDYTSVSGLNVIQIQGVGLVMGLDGTGGDPPPSIYRTKMLEDMKKREISNRNEILQSPNTSLVLIRGYIPPLIRKGEHFDIEVRSLGNDETKSLNGGWLMEAFLAEEAIVPGEGQLTGKPYARAKGPILVSTAEVGKDSVNPMLTRGKILGGGISLIDRDLSLYLRSDVADVRNSKRLASRIGQRFYNYSQSGKREPLAEAKTDHKIELKLHPRYKENFPRYLQVIRHISFKESDVAQRVRMERLKEHLAKPETSEKAALELEAIGIPAIPILKAALKHKTLEVRFHASVALAYLGEPDGISILAEAARAEPAFRVFAYAAMAAVDDADSHAHLCELMSEASPETRYGAFRALTTLDKNDPFIRGEELKDKALLHELQTSGPPMIHLTNRRKAEVVLFGADQTFRTPMAVKAGTKIMVTGAAGTDQIVVSKYEVGKPDRREVVSTRVGDVIRKVSELGASYPDIAQMLVQAGKQKSTVGSLQIDAVPKAGLLYERPELAGNGKSKKKARVGNAGLTPNIYGNDSDFDPKAKLSKGDESESEGKDKKRDIETVGGEREESSSRDSGIRPADYVDDESMRKPSKYGKNDDLISPEPEWKRRLLNPFRKKSSNVVEPEAID